MAASSDEAAVHNWGALRVSTLLGLVRSGAWLTPARLRAYPRIVGIALALALVALVATSHGGVDRWKRPLGTDFSGVWVAGQAVRAVHPAQPYDNAAHAAAQATAFGPSDSFLPWPYPPFFLLVAGALAALPYLVALATWQIGTLALYLLAIARTFDGVLIRRRDVMVAALAFPAVAINLVHGQNGFLSAGLVTLGTLLLPRRPLFAGACLGLLAYKPQLALALPVALLAGRHWRASAAAAATVAVMVVTTLLAFGVGPWRGFMQNLGFARRVILEMGGLETYKLQSAFAAARLYGAPLPLAYAAQGAVSVAALGALAWLWWSDRDERLKLAGVASVSLLVTPYAIDYDMVLLGPAIAALVAVFLERGFPPYGKSLLAFAWMMPLVARTAAKTLALPLGLMAMLGLVTLVVFAGRDARPGGGSAADHQL